MREDDVLWWTPGSWRVNGKIEMCLAADIFEACQTFAEPAHKVHQCTAPYLLKRAEAHADDGFVWEEPVESFPSVYDQFTRPGFRGWDYQAMRDAGYEVD